MSCYVPAWPVLDLQCLGRRPAPRAEMPFPLSAEGLVGFHVARYAIYHLFRTLALRREDAVLVPAYHHGNEVRAIREAGARVRFYGIDRRLQPDLEGIEALAREGARVLYVIHYLGWPQPLEDLRGVCRRYGMLLVEDCALALLSEVGGRPLGSVGDYAVFCLYKTVPVPNGGVLVGREGLGGLGRPSLAEPGALTVAARLAELMLQGLRSRYDTLGRPLLALKRASGRALTAAGVDRIAVGDDRFDLSAAGLGLSAPTRWLLPRLSYAEVRSRRRAHFLRLQERLAGRVTTLLPGLDDGVCPLFFPVLVEDKAGAARALRRRGVETLEFWNEGDPGASDFPDVRFLRRRVLELPVHQHLTARQVDYVADEVLRLAAAAGGRGWSRAA